MPRACCRCVAYSRTTVQQLSAVWFARELLFDLRRRAEQSPLEHARLMWGGVRVLPRKVVCPLAWSDHALIAAAKSLCTDTPETPKCQEASGSTRTQLLCNFSHLSL